MAALIPPKNRLFVCEYSQLLVACKESSERALVREGPLVLGRLKDEANPVLQLGLPENMVTWELTSEMPTLKVGSHAFMFAVPFYDKYYIIEFLNALDAETMADFERLLQEFTAYAVSGDVQQMQSDPAKQEFHSSSGCTFKTNVKTAQKIQDVGTSVAKHIEWAGDKLGSHILNVGEWYRSRNQKNVDPVKVSRVTKATLHATKATTSTVAYAAGAVASAVGSVVGAAAGTVAKGVNATGTTKEGGMLHGVSEVGKASLFAVIEVFDSMHNAGRQVVSQGAAETATCVEYKYGAAAGSATRTGTGIATDAYDVYGAYRKMRTSALMKTFAKGAASGIGRASQGENELPNGPVKLTTPPTNGAGPSASGTQQQQQQQAKPTTLNASHILGAPDADASMVTPTYAEPHYK